VKSKTLPSFWDAYQTLPDEAKKAARKSYQLWCDLPFHPSLRSNVLNKKNVSGPSVSRETTGPWVFWKVTQSRGFGQAATRTTNGNSDKPTATSCD
jgi:hypothetical protein